LGDKWAMFNLGMLYELGGDGLARDGTKAAEWDKKASDAGVRGMSVGFLRVFTREKRCPTCFKPKNRSWRELEESRSVPSVSERISCEKRFFSGAGTERLARI